MAGVVKPPPLYLYAWKNNPKRLTLYGRKLRVIVRGPANSALVEFEDGQREVISRNAMRRIYEDFKRNGRKNDNRKD